MQLQRIISIGVLVVLAGFFTDLNGQTEDPIPLRNASFEDFARAGSNTSRPPRGWYDCGKPGETAPDIHGENTNFFKVNLKASNGSTFLGMVARDNETWEGICQRLPRALEAGRAYTFGIDLARAATYISPGRTTGIETNYVKPLKLRIWGGNGYCQKAEMLAESALITHSEWRQYQFRFEPKKTHNYFLLEVFWQTPALTPSNGNILIDNATPIYVVPADEPTPPLPTNEPPIVKIINPKKSGLKSEDNTFTVRATLNNVKEKKDVRFTVNGESKNFIYNASVGSLRASIVLRQGDNKIVVRGVNGSGQGQDEAMVVYYPKVEEPAAPPIVAEPTPPKPRTDFVLTPELNSRLPTGRKIRLEKLYFQADSSRINEEAFPILDEFADYLKQYPDIKVEIGGHTNNRCDEVVCNRLSNARAKAVADYLVQKGIARARLQHKGYGKENPIADNNSYYGRRKNQRVEIKIL
ncbi:MAG: OmpA family protein [Bacteroidota bacterium]